ncbi:MAG: CYTH domain-containing protein [Eubacteriales bacterium]|nr:CYTH domain-containing protein [Eubacteriales bacterium]
MGREFELKYQATSEIIECIHAKFGEFSRISMETTYYDTEDLALRRRKWTLRQRLENGRAVCTVKMPLPDGSRGEWEVENTDLAAGVQQLCAMGAPGEILDSVNHGVAPFCGAKFTRLAKTIDLPGGRVELALDEGVLLGGGRELPFAEVEVELKDGGDSVALDFADALAAEFGLKKQPKSKLARAMALTQL